MRKVRWKLLGEDVATFDGGVEPGLSEKEMF